MLPSSLCYEIEGMVQRDGTPQLLKEAAINDYAALADWISQTQSVNFSKLQQITRQYPSRICQSDVETACEYHGQLETLRIGRHLFIGLVDENGWAMRPKPGTCTRRQMMRFLNTMNQGDVEQKDCWSPWAIIPKSGLSPEWDIFVIEGMALIYPTFPKDQSAVMLTDHPEQHRLASTIASAIGLEHFYMPGWQLLS